MPALLREDMEAINKYIMETPIKTAAADKIKNEWIVWWRDNKRDWTWYSQEEYDTARNIRLKFNTANATTVAEKTAVSNQAKGITSEEAKGGVKRSTSEGLYIVPEPPLVSDSTKLGIFAILVLGGLGYIAKIAYIDPILTPVTKALAKAKTKKILEGKI